MAEHIDSKGQKDCVTDDAAGKMPRMPPPSTERIPISPIQPASPRREVKTSAVANTLR